ncbi:TPA: sensor histidine kinase [Streptococcus suis]
MINKMRKLTKSDNFSYFIRYFAVFTLIFISMTAIIFQLMRSTMYRSTDIQFDKIKQHPDLVLNFAAARMLNPDSEIILQHESNQGNASANTLPDDTDGGPGEPIRLGTNFHVLLYNSAGELVNSDVFSGLSELAFDKESLKNVKEVSVEGPFGDDDFRYTTLELPSEVMEKYSSLDLKYATICVNVSQIKMSIQTYERTVAIVMVSFWFISLFASLYLAQLSMRPILLSYQKQKDFVENASHELRTPLTVLQNRLEGLFRHPNATIIESSESIASSLDEVRNMRILTSNLLNLARRDDGFQIVMDDLDPQYLEEIFDNFNIIAEESGKDLLVTNHIKQPIRTDKALLKQLLTIIFDNALKYTGDDGQISIQARVKDKFAYFTVADNGIGISQDDKTKVFDRFYRVDKARTRQKGGFGLGLSLAKQISDSLKGEISIRDNQPTGTIFEIKIPR